MIDDDVDDDGDGDDDAAIAGVTFICIFFSFSGFCNRTIRHLTNAELTGMFIMV